MEKLLQRSDQLVKSVSMAYIRNIAGQIDWKWRLTGIIGARGVGKTTLLLQQLKQFDDPTHAVYITLDDIWFSENHLIDFIETFHQRGGKVIFIDEIHKYPNWAKELKNAYDYFPDIRLIFTGSSIIEILKQEVDLSRRALTHTLPGLSFREYLQMTKQAKLPIVTLEDLLSRHREIALDLSKDFRPYRYYSDYLKQGYYPFIMEGASVYLTRVESMVRLVVESDLQFIKGYDPRMRKKVYQLLYILATSVPFKPNISKLSQKIGTARSSLTQYLEYLSRAKLINSLSAKGSSISTLQKPDKVYLENTNLAYALAPENVNIGALRETFFFNQLLNAGYAVGLPKKGDFFVEDKYTFEIGGPDKSLKQIKNTDHPFVAADEIETGVDNKIPLWLFGLLY